MNAIFARSKDDQIIIKLVPGDSNEGLLLEEWLERTGQRSWVEIQGDKTVLLYPKQPQ